MIHTSHLQLNVFTLSFFPRGNPFWLEAPVQGPPAMSSTEGKKDLNQGRAPNEKTDTSNLLAGGQGALLLSMAGSQDVSFQPALLWAEVMRSLGKSYTGEFDQRIIKRELMRLCCWSGTFVLFPRGWTQGPAVKRSREHAQPQVCPFSMLASTIMRAQFAAPLSHGAGSGFCSARLQQYFADLGLIVVHM